MRKSEFIDQVAANSGLSKDKATKAVDAVLQIIEETLSRCGEVNLTGFGLRCRVVRSPYDIAHGLARNRALILPAGWEVPDGFQVVGLVQRREADEFAVGYEFDLKVSKLRVLTEPNPNAGRAHRFTAYRVTDGSTNEVTLAPPRPRGRRRAS